MRREQENYYSKELKALLKQAQIADSSPISKFNPYLAEDGMVRLSGRLDRDLIPKDQRNPILLPDVSPLAKLLIREAHKRTLHGGPRVMMAVLRQKFWITNLRRAIRTSNSRCVDCIRERKQMEEQMMACLPKDRIEPYRAFKRSGVDYAGPFLLKARSGRCKVMEKKYVAVFVCMVTKAVHLELDAIWSKRPTNSQQPARDVPTKTENVASLLEILGTGLSTRTSAKIKMEKAQPNLKVGDLVIVREDGIPPAMWKSARVIEVFPDKDGLVRNVSLKMATADWDPQHLPSSRKKQPLPIRRPVQKLCRLPVETIEAETSRGQDVRVGLM